MIRCGVYSPYVLGGVPALVWGGLCLLPVALRRVLSSAHFLKRWVRSFATGVGLWGWVLVDEGVDFVEVGGGGGVVVPAVSLADAHSVLYPFGELLEGGVLGCGSTGGVWGCRVRGAAHRRDCSGQVFGEVDLAAQSRLGSHFEAVFQFPQVFLEVPQRHFHDAGFLAGEGAAVCPVHC